VVASAQPAGPGATPSTAIDSVAARAISPTPAKPAADNAVRERRAFLALRVAGTGLVLFMIYALWGTAAREAQSQHGL